MLLGSHPKQMLLKIPKYILADNDFKCRVTPEKINFIHYGRD